MVGHARRIVVAEELDVAAKRNGGQLPARAVLVVEADDLRAEAEREDQHLDAAPARHQEMAEFVEKHDDGEHEQERHDIADRAAAECAQAPDDVRYPLQTLVVPGHKAVINITQRLLGCLYGIIEQDVAG